MILTVFRARHSVFFPLALAIHCTFSAVCRRSARRRLQDHDFLRRLLPDIIRYYCAHLMCLNLV